ncbi:GNAT family N-acetyltransferase [Desulforamulus aquiferis]|uniref:GNAT family N-acetyltransferase n=1 Tax=Desulforamulus aquiferis TaxID=1397668 RepID=A0AAW7ZIP3_9FIRM|nr:GNAT family N-acetyltransferase [Desulforamulus aquiferis]MDO7789078.1 GNAT family N-acetyltransferase [Desulforamulus aquiferis]
MKEIRIDKIKSTNELSCFVDIIRKSFATEAENFGLNEKNAPTNGAFINETTLFNIFKDAKTFGVYLGTVPIGFFALKHAKLGTYYLEKLCILPNYRHNGYGKDILNYCEQYVLKNRGVRISIGIINENSILKEWYINNGYYEIETKKIGHLPFTVCLMNKELTSESE